jgi:predicted regulator of Ras-like GTPase activity (Roadblock/LC7/MglB family)
VQFGAGKCVVVRIATTDYQHISVIEQHRNLIATRVGKSLVLGLAAIARNFWLGIIFLHAAR